MTQGRGFTLVELLVTVSIIVVLTSVAFPPFQSLLQRNKATSSANLLLSHIQLARMRAVMDGATVVVCPTTDGITCSADSEAWSHGWLTFKDLDYQQPPQPQLGDTVLSVHRNNGVEASLHTSLNHLRFSPSGNARNGTITICPDGSGRHARAVILSIVGRARVSSTDSSGQPLNCGARTP
jgi:type IV fimbrial biogenesis protein FimT